MKRIDPSVGIEKIRRGSANPEIPPAAGSQDNPKVDDCRMYQVDPGESKKRLDHYLAQKCLPFSRSRVQKILEEGLITVNGVREPASYMIRGGDLITVQIPPPAPSEDHPEEMDLDIVYEDDVILVLNKPPQLVVHPAPGHRTGTLLNGLLGHLMKKGALASPDATLPRVGLVHRLDQDTSGLMVIGKTPEVLDHLMGQFKDRKVTKSYVALVIGIPPSKRGTIDAPIGRSSGDRKKFAVTSSGKPSLTKYRVMAQYEEGYALIDITLLTGRTHQIRVHFHHLGFPLAGDPVYRKKGRKTENIFTRIMLHSARLGFTHPVSGKEMLFSSPLPADMQEAIASLTELNSLKEKSR